MKDDVGLKTQRISSASAGRDTLDKLIVQLNEELHNSYSPLSKITMIKSRVMRWQGM
jgi:hypothetical protein